MLLSKKKSHYIPIPIYSTTITICKDFKTLRIIHLLTL